MATKAKAKPPEKVKVKPAPVRAPAPGDREIRGTAKPSELRPCPTNPRQSIPEASVQELAASFAQVGVLQPLVVRPVPLTAELVDGEWTGLKHFEIVAGHRRWAAAKLARLPQVPVVVRWLSDEDALLVQLVENDQREDVKPSEQAAAYSRLAAAGKTAEEIAAATGKPVGFVRGLLRLAKLPAWALAAVDAGRLPRATAELVARVPGEESRKKAAACVLGGYDNPRTLNGEMTCNDESIEEAVADREGVSPLSYRETRDLIRTHFTRELKGAPFSRTALDLLDGVGSCDACPSRAGNDPEAVADDVRADTCLDPDCYRRKAEAQRQRHLDAAAAKGIVPVPDEFAWGINFTDAPKPPKGWCILEWRADATELKADFTSATPEPLKKLLGKDGPQRYIAFHRDQPVFLVKTAEARKALIATGFIAKPEPRKREKPTPAPSSERPEIGAATPPAPKEPVEPREWEIGDRANLIAAVKVRDCAEANFENLDKLAENGGPDTDAAYEALRFVGRVLIRDWLEVGDTRLDLLKAYVPDLPDSYSSAQMKAAAERVYKAIEDATPRRMLGFLLHLTAGVRIAESADERAELLGHYDVDWDQCKAAAEAALKRELNGESEACDANIPADDPDRGEMVHVALDSLDGFRQSTLDTLEAHGILTVPALMAAVDAEVAIDLPPRNKLCAYLVKLGCSKKEADQAAESVAKHLKANKTQEDA